MNQNKRKNALLIKAKKNKKDEFYTQLKDIESELQYYKQHFKNKVVLCNCDDPLSSNFFKFFVDNFKELGLKKLIASCYLENQRGYYFEYNGTETETKNPTLDDVIYFKNDGDFRNEETIELLKQADIVVTNPPFSLFREFILQLVEFNKDFLVIANINAITYKEIFKLIKENKVWLGINFGRAISGFIVPQDYELYGTEAFIDAQGNRIVATNNCLWLTTLDNYKRHQNIELKMQYFGNEVYFPKYDNYDAININKTNEIPYDYKGHMVVPITFLNKFNPKQFEIIKFRKGNDDKDLSINGKCPYFRILIKNKLINS
ncbi:adenine-specific methyltransferase EcoRI family protein [Mycoplasma procyoni]|uniref:adenine-specific methyltransferase EcoRI family protein n=1 Tax=Mycoplasma procyoni TaxID=568784 RepID=UPI00197BEB55|nr:adenine-specific methyltransferase EcoRI family protein [Mycoplasma procyoni]MBN3534652.1 adenine-specific methyltransferase EcoRI family protein [Mycoplasma procyoni]